MSRTVDSGILTQARSAQTAKEVLVAIAAWGGTTIRWNLTGVDLSYGGNTYDGRVGSFGVVAQGTDQQLAVDLTVDDADYSVTKMVGSNDPRGCAVTVTEVWVHPTTRAVVAARTVGSDIVIGGLKPAPPRFRFGIRPSRRESGKSPSTMYGKGCPKTFKSNTPAIFACGYVGAETECDRSYTRCVALGNELNYGGVDMLNELGT